MNDFRRVLEILASNRVRYVVVGGAAMGLQGSSYRTQDIDIVYARDRENVERIVAALAPLKPKLRVEGEVDGLPFRFDVQTVLNGANFTMTTAAGDIDILAAIAGLGDYENVRRYADEIAIIADADPTFVLSLDGLIRSKRAANRAKDLLVLPELESMQELRIIEQQHDVHDLGRDSPNESS
ncbi:MAG TPA: hypothetical protein VE826_11920 [Dongiaceae bacterium]|nr:hypothetical protein [Dongiaceae bacterium]